MKKDRFIAFFDAIMAIIMTIVVLEFVIPEGTDWKDLSTLGYQILAYAISFFWLGGMWINLHDVWYKVDSVNRGILWTNIVMVFFASMIPFLVVYVGRNLDKPVPQVLYGLDVILITVCNWISIELLNRNQDSVKAQIKGLRFSLIVDLIINVAGLIIGITLFPMAIIISIAVARAFLIVWRVISVSKKKKAAA